jgi:hypothetical protein
MHCGLEEGQIRRWKFDAKAWFTDKNRDTFVVVSYDPLRGDVTVYEPGYAGTSRYTPEYISQKSSEVKDVEG